jgi:hypothetical protein
MTVVTTFEQVMLPTEVNVEDSGAAKIWEPDTENAMFVRLQSYDETAWIDNKAADSHPEFNSLIGKTVRITIEVLDDV